MKNFTRCYSANDDIDMTAMFGEQFIGTVQLILFQMSREMAPIYTMGNKPPRRVSGSIVFSEVECPDTKLFDVILKAKDKKNKPTQMKVLCIELTYKGLKVESIKPNIEYFYTATGMIPWENIEDYRKDNTEE